MPQLPTLSTFNLIPPQVQNSTPKTNKNNVFPLFDALFRSSVRLSLTKTERSVVCRISSENGVSAEENFQKAIGKKNLEKKVSEFGKFSEKRNCVNKLSAEKMKRKNRKNTIF